MYVYPVKKTILLSLFVILCANAKSQLLISILLGNKLKQEKMELGIDGGLSLSTITNQSDAKFKGSFNLGLYIDFKLKNSPFTLFTGYIPKLTLGATRIDVFPSGSTTIDTVFKEGYIKRNLNYFGLPFGAKYNFKNNLFIGVGVQIAFLFKAKDYYLTKIKENEDLEFHQKVTSKFNSFDWGASFRFGYEFKKSNNFKIYLNYYQGFVNIYRSASPLKRWNSVINLNFQIPIGNKAEK